MLISNTEEKLVAEGLRERHRGEEEVKWSTHALMVGTKRGKVGENSQSEKGLPEEREWLKMNRKVKRKQWERRGKKCLREKKYLSVLTTGPSDPVSLSLNSSQTNFPAALEYSCFRTLHFLSTLPGT